MRIVGRERLELFCRKHADARAWMERALRVAGQWLEHIQRTRGAGIPAHPA